MAALGLMVAGLLAIFDTAGDLLIGGAKTHLQHAWTAAAITVVRMGNGLMKKPLAKTRTSTCQQLSAPPVCC